MKSFFEGIQWLFEKVIFAFHDVLRELELSHWFLANALNWVFMIICTVAMVYWCKQLKTFDEQGTENQDTTAHSFLK
jgi:hypothetical protein